MPDANENHHIQITSRRGAIVIEGPDKDWVSREARWALEQLPEAKGSMGFQVDGGGSNPPEGAGYQPPLWEMEGH